MSVEFRLMIVLTLALLVLAVPVRVKAEDGLTGNLEKTLEYFGADTLDGELRSISDFGGKGFADIVIGVINGSITLTFPELLAVIAERFFGEVYGSLTLMRDIVVIAILGAVLKSLSASFGESNVTEIGFYIIYIAVVSLLIVTFVQAAEMAASVIGQMARFMQALLPLVIALLAASGRYAVSFVFHPLAIGVIQIATLIINNVVMKLIIFTAAVHMVSYLLPAGSFEQMAELSGKIIGKGLKWLAVAFMSFVTLKTAVAPIVGGVVGRGAKFAVSSVPVVGQVFAGAVDSAYYWSNSVKNGVAATGIIVVAVICAVPVIKLCAMAFLYKLTAALIQPVADERIVECMDAAGNYVSLFIVAVASVAVMFVVLLMMVMAAAIG